MITDKEQFSHEYWNEQQQNRTIITETFSEAYSLERQISLEYKCGRGNDEKENFFMCSFNQCGKLFQQKYRLDIHIRTHVSILSLFLKRREKSLINVNFV
jgi:hypothetical protein